VALGELTQRALKTHIDTWVKIGLSTERSDRASAEGAVFEAYRIVGLPPPRHCVWLDSPMSGAIAAALTSTLDRSVHDRVWKKPQEFMTGKFWTKVARDRERWSEIQEHMNRSALFGLRNGVLLPIMRQVAQATDASPAGAPPVRAATDNRFPRNTLAATRVPERRVAATIPTAIWNLAVQQMRAFLTGEQEKALNETVRQVSAFVYKDTYVSWPLISQQTTTCGYGSMDAATLAFIDYCHLSGFKLGDIEGITAVAKSSGWWWPFADFCIITQRPTMIRVDGGCNLHAQGERAIGYADGWGTFALNGNAVPEQIARFAAGMTVQAIEAEPNIEIRRRMIDMYGLERFILDSGAVAVQSDSCGILYRKELLGEEPVVVVRVINSTPEPDGSFREYFLRVPPTTTTAHAAVAWTFGLNSVEYTPEAQT